MIASITDAVKSTETVAETIHLCLGVRPLDVWLVGGEGVLVDSIKVEDGGDSWIITAWPVSRAIDPVMGWTGPRVVGCTPPGGVHPVIPRYDIKEDCAAW